jgi:hypothetical protein
MPTSSGKTPDLDRALGEWRRSGPAKGRLSQPARASVMRAALEAREHPRRIEPQIPLFFPLRRMALATALPAVLLCAIAGYLLVPGAVMEPAADSRGTIVQSMRQGDEVVFVIVNGNTPHTVRKSHNASDLSAGETLTVSRGSFRDGLESDSNIVFYRID